jgi:hypothetical protein
MRECSRGIIPAQPVDTSVRHRKVATTVGLTFGMSWCSLKASSLALKSATRSLWVFDASFPTLAAN